MSKLVTNTANGETVRVIKVQFRFPAEQVEEKVVLIHVPVSTDGQCLINPNSSSTLVRSLTPEEHDKMVNAAEEAALRSILVK